MNRILTLLLIMTIGCAGKDKFIRTTSDSTDGEFYALSESTKVTVFSELGETFHGDYRKYTGQSEDSTRVQLALNQDNRFAIGFQHFSKPFIKNDNGDTLVLSEFTTKSDFKNMCVGRWTDEGKVIKLKFLLGQSEFFDSLQNGGVIEFIDDKTVLLDKDAKGVWISSAFCETMNFK